MVNIDRDYPVKAFEALGLKDAWMAFISGVPGERLSFVDDGPSNIETAKEAGFMTFMPENETNWIPDLQNVLTNSVTSRNRGR